MSIYRATAYREGDWWVIDVDGVGVTQAKRLDQVEHMARDMVVLMEDVTVDDVHVEITPEVGAELDGLILGARSAAEAAKRAQSEAIEANRATAGRLRDAGYSLRDIAALTGVSYQRVHQLLEVKATADRSPHAGRSSASGRYMARTPAKAKNPARGETQVDA